MKKGCLFVHPFTIGHRCWQIEEWKFDPFAQALFQIAELVAVCYVSRQELQQPCRATLSAFDVMLQALSTLRSHHLNQTISFDFRLQQLQSVRCFNPLCIQVFDEHHVMAKVDSHSHVAHQIG